MYHRYNNQRPSVRSISETPNVIGAHINSYTNDFCSILLAALSWTLIVLFFPFSIVLIFRVVQEYERG
jgi:hypothetical protein